MVFKKIEILSKEELQEYMTELEAEFEQTKNRITNYYKYLEQLDEAYISASEALNEVGSD